MMAWFRLYNDVINDPKVMRLQPAMRWHWVGVLCCASKNEGRVPKAPDVAFMLRLDEPQASAVLAELLAAGLLDEDAEGLTPHNWDGRQFRSDSPNERVKRHRDKMRNVARNDSDDDACNVTGNVTETPPEQNRADTDPEPDSESDSDSDQTDLSRSVADATRPRACGRFDEFWMAYPRRDGPNPRKPAEIRFEALVKSGCDPQVLIDAAHRLSAQETARGHVGTRFIPQAVTWLNQQRWDDHASVTAAPQRPPDRDQMMEEAVRMFARNGYWSRHAGPEPGLSGCRAPPALLAKYGLAPDGRKLAASAG